MHEWKVAVARYSKFACSNTVYLKIWLYNNLDMLIYLTTEAFSRELTNQLNRFKKSTCANSIEVLLIAIRRAIR